MKKQSIKTWLWVSSSLGSSFLFYEQGAGINFLLNATVFVAISFSLYPGLRQSVQGKLIALGCLLTAVGVVWHHTWLAILMHLFSFIALAGFCAYPLTSLGVALPNGFNSALLSFWKEEWLIRRNNTRYGLSIARTLSWVVPVLVTALFLLLYMSANPAFAALIKQSRSEIISPGRIIFTLVSAYVLLAFFYPTGVDTLIQVDRRTPNTLLRRRASKPTRFINTIGLKHEYRTGWLLFALLNGLVLLFNFVDLYHLLTGQLPDGITYSEYVHQGVNALIASIALAIGIVMYFFRGNLNFYYRNYRLRMAAYGWIGQNMLVILTTVYKNGLYIDIYGLTQKRLGVYVYLLLALVGLFITYVKVRKIKSNAFLIRYTTWVFYAILGGLTLFNWPRFITQYNLTHLPVEQIDFQYLSRLSNHNLDLLQNARENPMYRLPLETQEYILSKISRFRYDEAQQDWRSWNYADEQVLNNLGNE